MKLLFMHLMIFLSFASYSQEEKIEIGVGAQNLGQSNQNSIGLNLSYKSEDGVFIPVNLHFGKSIRKFAAGAGYQTSADLSKLFTYSFAAAISYLNFDKSLMEINPKDQSRYLALLQQELSFQLSNRLSLAVQVDIDIYNFIRIKNHRDNTTTADQYKLKKIYYSESKKLWVSTHGGDSFGGQSRYDIIHPFPTYNSDIEKAQRLQSMKNSSGSSFGLSFRVRIND